MTLMGFEPQTFRPTVRRANHCAYGAGGLYVFVCLFVCLLLLLFVCLFFVFVFVWGEEPCCHDSNIIIIIAILVVLVGTYMTVIVVVGYGQQVSQVPEGVFQQPFRRCHGLLPLYSCLHRRCVRSH